MRAAEHEVADRLAGDGQIVEFLDADVLQDDPRIADALEAMATSAPRWVRIMLSASARRRRPDAIELRHDRGRRVQSGPIPPKLAMTIVSPR
jgi:hypothetical protein